MYYPSTTTLLLLYHLSTTPQWAPSGLCTKKHLPPLDYLCTTYLLPIDNLSTTISLPPITYHLLPEIGFPFGLHHYPYLLP